MRFCRHKSRMQEASDVFIRTCWQKSSILLAKNIRTCLAKEPADEAGCYMYSVDGLQLNYDEHPSLRV